MYGISEDFLSGRVVRSIFVPEKGDYSDDELNLLDDAEFEDESLWERIFGLTEMFPESFRSKVSDVTKTFTSCSSTLYAVSRHIVWFGVTTSVVCFLPLSIELFLWQQNDKEALTHRAMLLGPQASGGGLVPGFTSVAPQLTPAK
ncbi:unnamed protein product [Protopolystoma xenopodis]|uniref:Mitochondrial import receptor subunit TOM22 homolog n=1 Tax=Protopolystoma xenopodis TaxID=117903 RepID=A0A448WQA9_9PLAT|nr:unnamed protein product [Protopolystoma xenopodis]